MNDDDARSLISSALTVVVPGLNAADLDPDASLRLSVDLDSMNFLAYVSVLSEIMDAAIPEADYEDVDSLNGAVVYMVTRMR